MAGGILIAQALTLVVTTLHFDLVADYRLQVNQFRQQSSEIELVTFGNSHNLAIDMDEFEQKGYHLWRSGGDFFEVRYLVEHLVNDSSSIEIALIPASLFSFHMHKSGFEKLREDKIALYTVLPSWDFIEGELQESIEGKAYAFFPLKTLVREDHWQGVFRAITNKSLRTANTNTNINTKRAKDGQQTVEVYRKCEHKTFDELVTFTNDVGMPEHVEGQNISLEARPNLPAEAYATAVGFIQKLQAHDIRVVFYTPPYFETYNELYDKKTITAMKGYMTQLQQDHGVEYYDFSTDPEFIHDNRMFYDDDHLNACGAKKFSAKLNQILFESAAQ